MKVAQKLLLIILATSLLPLVAVGFPVLITTQHALRDQIQQGLNNIALHQVDRLSDVNQQTNAELKGVLNNAQLLTTLGQYNAKPSVASQKSLDQVLQTILTSQAAFHAIHVASPIGKVIASTDDSSVGADYSKAEVFSAGHEGSSINIFFTSKNHELNQYLTGPVTLKGQTLGVVIVEASTAPYLAITKDYSELGTTGESYLTRKTDTGKAQYLTPLRYDPSAALQPADPLNFADYRQQQVLSSSRSVPGTQWTLVVKTDKAEINAPLTGLRKTVLVILLFSLTAVILIAIFSSRLFTSPIVLLTEKTRRIIAGDFTQRITTNAHDEIGDLATAFNMMTTQLSESYRALEAKVVERTKSLDAKLQELANAKAKDDAILGSVGEGMLVTDNAGYILLINDIAASLLGVDRTAMFGKRASEVYKLYDENDQPLAATDRPLQIALTTSQKTNRTVRRINADGTKRALNLTATPVLQNGVLIGGIEIVRDITKEKEVDRMKTEFISLASHQLRTPLSAIRWFSEMLLSGDAGKLNPEQEEFAQNVADSTQRMIELVNSLLNISRIESGRIIIDPKPTDLQELVSGIVNDLKAKTLERQQTLVISVHKELPKINIDQRLIGQVYLNLLSNAIKYTPKGGEIEVFVSRKGDDVVSQVSDNGYGIPKAEQTKMFQKFFRAANVAKVETDGTGLGMYLVKSIIESSGGKIWFESEEGKGTTFWFTIPLSGMKAKAGEVTLDG